MAWRVAKSLLTLRDQVDAMAPDRSTSSDGTIGDTGHQARKSDHNPDEDGVVTAMDITHDPSHGVDAGALAEMLRLSHDPRIKYVISNRRIFSSKVSPWIWRPYDGSNAHTKHVHISVMGDKSAYDDTHPWAIDKVARVSDQISANRYRNITATVFGGAADPNNSAYDEHFITDTELGVALPSRFASEPRPNVRVINPQSGSSVVCDIVDVGPWNTNDPYWETNARPQAESGVDRRGRRTNLAGIDLTPAAARAVGIDGKGKVDWEFVGAPDVELRPAESTTDSSLPALRQRIEQLERGSGEVKMPMPANDLTALLQQVLAVLQNMDAQAKPAVQPASQQTDQLRKAVEIISTIIAPGAERKSQPLGQVNNALGQTVGNLLNGKKTAIGIFGALTTSLLGQVDAAGDVAKVIPFFNAASSMGLGGIAMPIFLATTAWGVLGKFEKWAQGTAPPPQPPK